MVVTASLGATAAAGHASVAVDGAAHLRHPVGASAAVPVVP
jgi:hypothetical protein